MKCHLCIIAACWFVIAVISPIYAGEEHGFALQDGDIVFTGSKAGQGAAISAATGSPMTHCGVVFQKDGKWLVLEAVQPVKITKLEDFMARAHKDTFAARRLKSIVTAESYQKAIKWAESQIGLNYDNRFQWDDKKLYCSELVWKFYQQAGIEICTPRKFRDYNLEHALVQKMIKERYGSMENLPMDEQVVAPSDLLASSLLIEVPKKAQ